MTEKVLVGSFGATHGFKGGIRIHSYTEVASDIFKSNPWHIVSSNQSFTVQVISWKNHFNKQIAFIDGYSSDSQVKLLTNSKIYICRSNLADLAAGSYYWSDLVGCLVINKSGYNFGTVVELFNNKAHDVLVIKPEFLRKDQTTKDEQEVLIPFVQDSIVTKVDLDAKIINVDWEVGF